MSWLKSFCSHIVPIHIWDKCRERKIIHRHAEVACLCECLVSDFLASPFATQSLPLLAKRHLSGDRIVWQYWGQGFSSAPKIIQDCVASVDKWCKDWVIIRLDDDSIGDYVELPPFLLRKKSTMSRAHFSDVLRLCLLYLYGGVWLDASVLLTAPIPNYMLSGDFFAYQRDPKESNKEYWSHVYAYYFGWSKGFRVNVLNSVLQSHREGKVVSILCGVMLYFWEKYDEAPDYFFFQILFDVLMQGYLKDDNCVIIGDCEPHYLQQYLNDPDFCIATKSQILETIPIHKLTYKH